MYPGKIISAVPDWTSAVAPGLGNLYCADRNNGKIIWAKDLATEILTPTLSFMKMVQYIMLPATATAG
ncbi:MAG: hypothetical protein A2X05_08365 [Bacteroidetes bacterium GWE2_41_25]|nr:MAG: hypothetical protein A2X03_06895 [Bacteroidetes bacterium GWA2_40_15]OFX91273.1 MAG: hypothetical protein A2X06_01540 [Bacteroidetes bacterium GWC2_40_22]OFX92936.1 MAG: hypothetical protein A2X05_08365 [Bacteroidetes bacterium GWE2_41_25]OFY61365.1 MAG: hypothetical protein A2X04_09305 [Bacteroidetes bacterium GWF2_41_9]HAM10445.1 hypothetical protein [Bacteroidales bacterium]